MNLELQKIDTYLAGRGLRKKSYTDLSKNSAGKPLVTNAVVGAYCYDDVSPLFLKIKSASADALLLKDSLYFIEFKTVAGSGSPGAQKYEIIKQNLFLKLSESLIVLEKCLVPASHAAENYDKYFIIVVDSVAFPLFSQASVMAGLSRGASNSANFTAVFDKYKQQVNGKYIFYKDVWVWNDKNFSVNVRTLK